MYKFSVITPVHLWSDERVRRFLITIESVKAQTFTDFEWIIIDDGSTLPFLWQQVTDSVPQARIIHQKHEERVIAYNKGFSLAEGEWFVLLDSDDEFKPNSLEKMAKTIDKYPKDKMFNFGAAYNQKDGGVIYRDPFAPKRRPIGHVKFGGGTVVNGTFIWHKSVYEDLGAYPESNLKNIDCSAINYHNGAGELQRDLYMGTPYDFSAAAQLQFPEIREYFMVPDTEKGWKVIKELGNPWGQDYYLFYKYTRKYHSRVFKEYLYIVNPR